MTVIDQLLALGNLAVVALTAVVAAVVILHAIDRFLVARIEITEFQGPKDDEAVAGMSEIVRSELVLLTEEGAGMGLFFLNGPDKPVELPADIKTVHLDLFAQVISWLPGRVTTVSGRIQPDGGHGRGVTVTLKGGWNRSSASTTIWERDIGVKPPEAGKPTPAEDAERYQRLAIAAAAWVAYRLVQRQSVRSRVALLTQDWLSYALFLMANRLTRQNVDADSVRPLYQAALERDPRNRGALFGLALLYASESANAPAAALFDACVDELGRAYPDEDERRRDRLWYRANLNAGIARLNEVALRATEMVSLVPGAAFPPDVTTAVLIARAQASLASVAQQAETTITDLVGDRPAVEHGPHGDLVRFLVSARDYAAVSFQASVA